MNPSLSFDRFVVFMVRSVGKEGITLIFMLFESPETREIGWLKEQIRNLNLEIGLKQIYTCSYFWIMFQLLYLQYYFTFLLRSYNRL